MLLLTSINVKYCSLHGNRQIGDAHAASGTGNGPDRYRGIRRYRRSGFLYAPISGGLDYGLRLGSSGRGEPAGKNLPEGDLGGIGVVEPREVGDWCLD